MARYISEFDQKWVEILMRILSPVKDEETRQAILDYLEENPGSSGAEVESGKEAGDQVKEGF